MFFKGNLKALTTLIKLTTRDYSRIAKNCRHVSGIQQEGGKKTIPVTTLYSTVTYGCNMKPNHKKAHIGDKTLYQFINLATTKNKYVVITGYKELYECSEYICVTYFFNRQD